MKIDKATLEKAVGASRERRAALWADLESSTDRRDALQRELDYAEGHLSALTDLYDRTFRFPVEPGTVLHGIDVSRLDWITRAMVMSRNLATIYALGGKPDPE